MFGCLVLEWNYRILISVREIRESRILDESDGDGVHTDGIATVSMLRILSRSCRCTSLLIQDHPGPSSVSTDVEVAKSEGWTHLVCCLPSCESVYEHQNLLLHWCGGGRSIEVGGGSRGGKGRLSGDFLSVDSSCFGSSNLYITSYQLHARE